MERKNYTYDLETLPNFFCAVFKYEDEYHQFEISDWKDDYHELIKFLKTNVNALRGYNNINFDSQIIEYLLKKKLTAKEIYEKAQITIDAEFPLFPEWKLSIFNLDIYKILHMDNKNRMVSLKWCEYMINWPTIEDMPHHGHIKSRQEADETIHYCYNDVNATDKLFDLYKKEIELRVKLSSKYNLPFLNASNSKIGSDLMLHLYCNKTNQNKREVKKRQTIRDKIYLKDIIFPYIEFETIEFQGLLLYFKDLILTPNDEFKKSFIYKGFQFDYGKGGIHGSVNTEIIDVDDNTVIIDADVASLYPSIAVVNKLYPEHLGTEFAEVYDKDIVSVRLAEKAKKDGDQIIVAGYKEAANSVYGKSNEERSWLRDFKYTLSTTINGQLMLTMLAEKLMISIPSLQMIQINTDGLTCKLNKNDQDKYYSICKDWESKTNLILEYANYDKMIIRDVNNYIARYISGKTKCKGAFEIDNIPLHKNKSELVVRIAIFNYFIKNILPEDTINNHNNIFDFTIGLRAKQDSYFVMLDKYGNTIQLSKTIRYIISNKGNVFKKYYRNGNKEYLNVHPQKGKTYYQTLLNTIENTDVKNYNVNMNYYIVQAYNEINRFNKPTQLF